VVKSYLQAVADGDKTEAVPLICGSFMSEWQANHTDVFSAGISHIDFTFHQSAPDSSGGLAMEYTLKYKVDAKDYSDDVVFLVADDSGPKICGIATQ
jgi:hypothetical protein